MVTGRSRLRVSALGLLMCAGIVWHLRFRSYGLAYPNAPTTPLAHFDNETNNRFPDDDRFPVPTPVRGETTARVTSAAQDNDDDDSWRDEPEVETKKYHEEMDKLEGSSREPKQENPESGVFMDKPDAASQEQQKKKLPKPVPISEKVDWSRFAYTQYVTNAEYLCNSVMMFETLHRMGSRADRLLMYPEGMMDPDAETSDAPAGKLLIEARDKYKVKLMPVGLQHREGADPTWADSFTKLLAFNQTQYDRVLSLDSDGAILQPMDELFLLPPSPVAMPRAYWLLDESPPKSLLSSQVLLVQPSHVEFQRIVQKIESTTQDDYDMEIVNALYGESAMILPHRPYDMLTGEWRRATHARYLGSDVEVWDPALVLSEAKYVHFSDWPVPKPWMKVPDELRRDNQPPCRLINGERSCLERQIWNAFYADFAEQRRRVCPLPLMENATPVFKRHAKRLERMGEE